VGGQIDGINDLVKLVGATKWDAAAGVPADHPTTSGHYENRVEEGRAETLDRPAGHQLVPYKLHGEN